MSSDEIASLPRGAMPPTSKRPKAEATVYPTICVLGATGVGKGSTLNSCFRSDRYGTSHRLASDTIKPASFVLPWRGTGELMRGVDLCGFSDSEGRDTGFIEAMVAYLRTDIRHVNCFLLLLNSQEPRLGQHLKDMLAALKNVFGVRFMENVLVGFTRWDYSRKGALLRRDVTKEALRASVNEVLRAFVGHVHDVECIFLDNTVNMCTEEELRALYTCPNCHACSDELTAVVGAFDDALGAVRRAALSNAPFACTEIESTIAERDIGRDQMQREKEAVALGDEACEAFARAWDSVETDAPRALDARLAAATADARAALVQALAAKCKPDLEHVMTAALEAFDGRAAEAAKGAAFKNRMGASSFNRQLRMRLVREYKSFIGDQMRDGGGRPPLERFEATRERHYDVLAEYVAACQGGPLAWQPFVVLQDQLRMEMVDGREKILRDDLVAGHELPSLVPSAKDAKGLLALLGTRPTPGWLMQLARETAPPGGESQG